MNTMMVCTTKLEKLCGDLSANGHVVAVPIMVTVLSRSTLTSDWLSVEPG